MSDKTNEQMIGLIRERALIRDIQVKLASGKPSTFYIDCKRLTLHGPSLKAVSAAFWSELKKQSARPTHVAGVSVGGDPLVAGVLMCAELEGLELSGLLVRKEKKAHGLSQGRAVDGASASDTKGVWLLEDVVSTGGSSLVAAEHLKSEGYALQGIMCLVDREMGGLEHLRQKCGVPVVSLFKVSQIAN